MTATIGTYLGALAPTFNKQGWTSPFLVTDEDTEEPIDISAATIVCEVADPRTGGIVLSGSTSDGHIAITDTGAFAVTFSRAETENLGPLDYDVGIVLTINGDYSQLVRATLPILDGIVTK